MELHLQKCQRCQSRKLRNILVRDEDQKVYVQCCKCHHLVARYVLSTEGYYHSGKEFESFLRSVERDGGYSSGKNLQERFQNQKEKIEKEFLEINEKVKEKYGGNIE